MPSSNKRVTPSPKAKKQEAEPSVSDAILHVVSDPASMEILRMLKFEHYPFTRLQALLQQKNLGTVYTQTLARKLDKLMQFKLIVHTFHRDETAYYSYYELSPTGETALKVAAGILKMIARRSRTAKPTRIR